MRVGFDIRLNVNIQCKSGKSARYFYIWKDAFDGLGLHAYISVFIFIFFNKILRPMIWLFKILINQIVFRIWLENKLWYL